MSNNRWNVRPNSAPLGTPENPEILEPGETRARPVSEEAPLGALRVKAARVFRMLMWMLSVTAPALFLDSLLFWLYDTASNGGGFFAWVLLILFTPPALFLTLVAMVVNSFLAFALFAGLLGRPVQTHHPAGFVRFIRF